MKKEERGERSQGVFKEKVQCKVTKAIETSLHRRPLLREV